MSTPHISAQIGDIAPSILLPGDPLRAKYIAETFFQSPVLFNEVRGMYGFTGLYKGKRLSVMGTGMGIPSISIYVSELLQFYGVKTLIRVGTCGSFIREAQLSDLLIAVGCCTDNGFLRHMFPGDYAPIADFGLLNAVYEKAQIRGLRTHFGLMKSGDMFYADPGIGGADKWVSYGVIGGEMEGAALYALSAKFHARALTMCTVVDGMYEKNELTSEEREKSLNDMITLALDTAADYSE